MFGQETMIEVAKETEEEEKERMGTSKDTYTPTTQKPIQSEVEIESYSTSKHRK